MDKFIGIVLKVLIEQASSMTIKIFKDLMLKKGIKIRAEKAVGHIQEGDSNLSNGNLQGWLDELNNENS